MHTVIHSSPGAWAVLSTTPACDARAAELADALKLPLLSATDIKPTFVLAVFTTHLEVQQKNTKPIFVDFLNPSFLRRLRSVHMRDPLLRAVGLKKNMPLQVLDATAGFGMDACVLAYHGAQVTLLERVPIMGALLQDGIARAQAQGELMLTAARMQSQIIDAEDYLAALVPSNYPDVIYIDPMFVHTKSALPNKNMQLLAQLNIDTGSSRLLDLALSRARKRVVIKRALQAPPLANKAPDMCIKSKLLRFDVFLMHDAHKI